MDCQGRVDAVGDEPAASLVHGPDALTRRQDLDRDVRGLEEYVEQLPRPFGASTEGRSVRVE